jgi:glycosyltransferase involved in cell wall biosynthesis
MTTSPRVDRSPSGIVYFGNDWFAENRTSSHHMARGLARRGPLLYVECPGLRAPRAQGRDLRKLVAKARSAARGPRRLDPLWLLTLPQIPFRRLPGVSALNRHLSVLALRRALKVVDFDSWMLWFVVPHVGHVAGRLGEKLAVYYCIDDYSALPDVDAVEIGRLDHALTVAADQVFVSSRTLLEAKEPLNPTTVYSPHGVDADLFGRAADTSLPVADGARGLARPVIGFFGLIEAWIDLELVAALARARPSWSFLLIGRVAVDTACLSGLSNVVLPGPQPYETLPDWARAFDVAILPYRRNAQVMAANPLKLREYLATGRPVVSVSTPEIERFGRWIRMADGPEDFLLQIEKALAERSPEATRARMESVASMSWDARVDAALETVCRRLDARKRST